MEGYYTTAEAAAIIGVSVVRIHHYLAMGLLPKEKHGRDYLIPVECVKSFVRPSGKPGRKPKAG